MTRYLDPKTDVVFKKIFGQHPHLLKSFLNAVLPLTADSMIESLEYLSSEIRERCRKNGCWYQRLKRRWH